MSASTAGRSSKTERLRASPPMFSSPLLDRLTRVHPVVVPLIYIPVIGVFAYLAFANERTVVALACLAGGYLAWTLAEYWLHRTVFHFAPERGIGARLHWMIHGVHHDHPNDPLRLVMPPGASLPLAVLISLGVLTALPYDVAYGVLAGFFAGYLAYDMTHYALHHRVPTSRFGRHLREAHMRHHFQDDHTGFGVSAPWWDHVFGTAPRSRRD